MQKSCRVSFMYGELTDKNTIDAIDEALETHQTEQFEILLYKKNRKSIFDNLICSAERFGATLKQSFYISYSPPSAHPSDQKKLYLTLPLSDVRPGFIW